MTQTFFIFYQLFLRFCHALSYFSDSVIFRFCQLFLSFCPCSFSDSVIFLDFVTRLVIFAIMTQSFFEMSFVRFLVTQLFSNFIMLRCCESAIFYLSVIIKTWSTIYQATKRAHAYGAMARGREGLARDSAGGGGH
jgi:hypothetical protein